MTKRKATLAMGFLIALACAIPSAARADGTTPGLWIEGVRTTAYSSSVEDNGPYGSQNALGRPLKSGSVTSAAADWSRYPVGTRFRVVETGQEYVVDDYGSALVGTGTIDLYKSRGRQVDRWGVRHVTIEILEWGSPERSLRILQERGRSRSIRDMVQSLSDQAAA